MVIGIVSGFCQIYGGVIVFFVSGGGSLYLIWTSFASIFLGSAEGGGDEFVFSGCFIFCRPTLELIWLALLRFIITGRGSICWLSFFLERGSSRVSMAPNGIRCVGDVHL